MKNILIVDDEKFVRLGISTMITRSGLCTGEIIQCKNGVEALAQLKKINFDVIFTDIKMPAMDGIELVQTIKKESLSDASLVMISGYDDFNYAVEALRNGVCEYLLKPVDRGLFQELLEKIQNNLEEKSLQGTKPIVLENIEESKQQKIESAIHFVQNHYFEDINMAVVSNMVSMNYTFFSETFKEETGKSFVDYLKTVRISMAKKLLRDSCVQISRVAFEVGFKDDKHFSKTFKAETGMTPSEYKKNQNNKEKKKTEMKLTQYQNQILQGPPEGITEFFSPEGIKDQAFLVMKVKNTSHYLQGLNLGFWREGSTEVDLNVTFGLIPQLETTLSFPLHYLDGQTMFLPRTAGTLKRVIFGQKITPQEVHRISLGFEPHFESQSLEIQEIYFSKEEPIYTVPEQKIVDAFGQCALYDWQGKIHSEDDLFQLLHGEIERYKGSEFPQNWSEYGGDLSLNYGGTGFFRTHFDEKLGQWLLIDPQGYGFFSVGLDCVGLDSNGKVDDFPHLFEEMKKEGVFAQAFSTQKTPHQGDYYNFSLSNMIRIFGEEAWEVWAYLTENLMKSWGFNTVGNWSDMKFCQEKKLPYVLPLKDFPSTKTLIFRDFPDVFSEEYEKNAQSFAQQLRTFVDDPYFIGYFLRNEPLWAFVVGMDLAEELLETGFPSACKDTFIKVLQEKYQDISRLNHAWKQNFKNFTDLNQPVNKARTFSPEAKEDLQEFSRQMIERYVSLPSIACKKVDQNHLNLGMRYAYIWNPALLAGCEHFDVFSFNCYKMNPVAQINSIGEMTNLPVMIGEFHFGAVDRGMMSTGLKGVSSQKERGTAYQFYVEQGAAQKYCVGTHYFTLNDQAYLGRFDGENFQIGVVDCCHRPYEDFLRDMMKTNQNIYQVKKGERKPSSVEGKEIPRIGF